MGKISGGAARPHTPLPLMLAAHCRLTAQLRRMIAESDGEDPRIDRLHDLVARQARRICSYRPRSLADVQALGAHFLQRADVDYDFEGSPLAMVLVQSLANIEARA